VPLVVVVALAFGAAAALLSLAAALSPVLLLGVLAWWIVKRNTPLKD
jgi:4-hydroxybenzoate polyprenyltransferase